MNEIVTIKQFDDRKEWYLNDKLHREDGPAVEWFICSKEWYLHGLRHRVDGPAGEYLNGQEWYLNGRRHRVDGPAINYSGHRQWYLNGKLHRENGPAIEWNDSYKEWFLHGKPHRIDGPAIEWPDGTKIWYLDDKLLSPPEIKAHQISRLRNLTLSLSPLQLPPYVIFWILEWSESAYIADLDQRSVIKMIEAIRHSRQKLKNIFI